MKYFLALYIFLGCFQAIAQNEHFIQSGEITYEKRVNSHALMNLLRVPATDKDSYINNKVEDFIQTHTQFLTIPSKLVFDEHQSYYQTTENILKANESFYFAYLGALSVQRNRVYNNFHKDSTISEKPLFEKPFLLKDKLSQIKWKLTTETRNIAGYECIRANGLILDSVYVVAWHFTALKSFHLADLNLFMDYQV